MSTATGDSRPLAGLPDSGFVQTLEPLLSAPRWLIALSGGLDSTVLLHLVQKWCQGHPEAPSLSVLHVNHGLQKGADAWESHCTNMCASLGVPCSVHRIAVSKDGAGIEAAARAARYEVFEAELLKNDVLLMAHHLDDQVETYFLRLMRGAGPAGLSGMPRQRVLGEGLLVRPLLHLTRKALEHYAQRHKLEYVQDPSNIDTSMDRNFLRREVLPLLETRWPAYRETVDRATENIAQVLLQSDAAADAPDSIVSTMGDPGLLLPAAVLEDGVSASRQIRAWLRSMGVLMPDRTALTEFVRQLCSAAEGSAPRMENGLYALQSYGRGVYLLSDSVVPLNLESLSFGPHQSLGIDGVGELSLLRASGPGIALEPGDALNIRFRHGGERCTPAGRRHSQSLKKLLQDAQIPPWWRQRVPLLFLGDELLAVGDLWLCQSSRYVAAPATDQPVWTLLWERNTVAACD